MSCQWLRTQLRIVTQLLVITGCFFYFVNHAPTIEQLYCEVYEIATSKLDMRIAIVRPDIGPWCIMIGHYMGSSCASLVTLSKPHFRLQRMTDCLEVPLVKVAFLMWVESERQGCGNFSIGQVILLSQSRFQDLKGKHYRSQWLFFFQSVPRDSMTMGT